MVDILKNGLSITLSGSYVTIPVSGYTGYTTSLADYDLVKGDYLQFSLIQGDSTASDLTVHVRYKWEL